MGFLGCILFLISTLAETNRCPFDIPEAESELIAGHMTEYSGFKYALFFMAEFVAMFAMCALTATLFLGGFHAPAPYTQFYSWPSMVIRKTH
jgi:NADH-quinone oxidoreductase subunit H